MSAFEYVSVIASIIIGLALADMLTSVHRLIRAGPRVRWNEFAPVMALMVLLTLIMIWWSLYRPEDRPMTIAQFLPLLVEMILPFLWQRRPCPTISPTRASTSASITTATAPISGACSPPPWAGW